MKPSIISNTHMNTYELPQLYNLPPGLDKIRGECCRAVMVGKLCTRFVANFEHKNHCIQFGGDLK